MGKSATEKTTTPVRRWALRLAVLAALWLCAVGLVYYWRVFYSYGLYPFASLGTGTLTVLLGALATAGWGIALLTSRLCKEFPCKAAVAVFCVGLLFCFINPPLETPDEINHYLRSYSISCGHFDFDYARTYPQDVNALVTVYRGAWSNVHDRNTIKVTDAGDGTYTDGENIANSFAEYQKLAAAGVSIQQEHEPILRMVVPFLPQALGMAIARLFGGGALACLYGGRIGNLLVYSLLCLLALKKAKRYCPVFFAFMLLPLSLYLAASVSYEGLLLGLLWVVLSYFCADEITGRDVAIIACAVGLLTAVKVVNILFLVLPFLLPASAWKTRLKKWQAALICLAAGGGLYLLFTWYGNTFMFNYPEIGRMLGSDVNVAGQTAFVFSNLPRFVAVLFGTLYENGFFFTQLGLFAALDVDIPLVTLTSCGMLCAAAMLSVHEKSSLPRRSLLGLLGLAIVYAGAVCAGLYVTYTPVGMVRIIGLQARYFLPTMFLLTLLAAAALSHVLKPALAGGARIQRTALALAISVAVLGAVLLAQHYYVGPVTVVQSEAAPMTEMVSSQAADSVA